MLPENRGLTMEYIIGIIILLFALFLTGYLIKKKYYKEMDRLESWKIDLNDRPVQEEMSKVKLLNMTGQTEELFERWRNEWDEIVTVKLPNLEELLFDAEEYIDKYRFRRAKEVQFAIEQKLKEIEERISAILEELNSLVGSEEKNRIEIEELRELYRESKKTLFAHRLSFGKAEKTLELGFNEVSERFQDFEEKTENGNYLEAREVVLTIKDQLENIKKKMDLVPQHLVECQSILPGQLDELNDGYREMVRQGYYLSHLQFESEMDRLNKEMDSMLVLLEEAETDQLEKAIGELKESIDQLFDLLEKEVHAKHHIVQNENQTASLLESIFDESKALQDEVLHIQQSYHLPENELDMQRQLEKQLGSLYKRFHILTEKIKSNETPQSSMSEELKQIKDELDAVREEQQGFASKLQALRKDEIDAREKVNDLIKRLNETARLVTRSNIPGLPEDYKYLFEDGHESINNVKQKLQETPLDIPSVHQYLEIAALTVDKLINTTNEMIENIVLAEKIIQYGNRYRSRYPSIAKGLRIAEEAFRKYDYRGALEQAATTIEEIDPGALKKIESNLTKE